jgi:radical SAM protein with 4Fe4S-binding SPASM domain
MRYVLRVERGFGLLYDRQEHGYQRLTAHETFLVAAGQRLGASQARAALTASAGVLEAEGVAALLESRGVLGPDGAFDGRVVELPPCDGTYAAPLAAHIGLTTACNFACRHCYSSSGKKSPGELTRAEIERVLDELAAIGCQQLVFGGGEPFLRRDLPPLIARANALDIDTYVHTNASLVTPQLLEALSLVPPTGLTISLDGSTAELNDRVRGPGTFEATMAAMRLIRATYTPGFAISMTITGVNHTDTVAMVELAQREGASLLLLRPPCPAGNMLRSRELMTDLRTFWGSVGAARARGLELGMMVNCPEDGGAVLPTDFEGFGCIAGHVVLGITPTGEVTPCLNLPDEYIAGNIRQHSVLELWRDGASFTQLRGLQPNDECKTCEHYAECRGGCRIRAIDAGHGVDGKDTWCYREEARGLTPFGASAEGEARRERLRVIG